MKNIIDTLKERYGDRYALEVLTYDSENPIPYEFKEYHWQGVRVTALSTPATPDLDWIYQDDEVRRLFAEFLAYCRPQLIHFHSIQRLTASLLEAARQQGIPYAVTLHDAWWLSDHQFLIDARGELVPELQRNPVVAARHSEDIVKSIERSRYLAQQLEGAAAVLAVSEYQQGLYRRNGFAAVAVNKNGVREPGAVESPVTGALLRFGYMGGISRHKGFHALRQAISEGDLQHSELKVIDFDLPTGQQRTERWGSTPVTFLGRFPSHEVGEFFRQIDVLVAPSIWPESFGLITREANLAGKWVLASAAGGLAEEVIEGVTGHVFPLGDHTALRQLLQRVDAAPERYQRPIDRSRLEIRSVGQQVAELVAVYDEIIDRSSADDVADVRSAQGA